MKFKIPSIKTREFMAALSGATRSALQITKKVFLFGEKVTAATTVFKLASLRA
jgi:hypothetical protein